MRAAQSRELGTDDAHLRPARAGLTRAGAAAGTVIRRCEGSRR